MSDNKCYVCLKNLGLNEEHICSQCELKDDDDAGDNGEVTNNVNCGACEGIVEEDSEGLSCDLCNTWYHNECCENPLIEVLYSLLNEAPNNIKWFCDKCIWETEKWFKGFKDKTMRSEVYDKEQENDHKYLPKEPEIKIEIQSEGMPIDLYDRQSSDSDDRQSPKVRKKIKTKNKNTNKPYKCDQCGKGFSYRSSYTKHVAIHNGTQPYSCNQCELSFADIDALRKHIKTHPLDKVYQCFHCGKGFTRPNHLKIHERIHTGERSYQCTHCGKTFHQQNHLIKHERVHTGEKPYQCSHCDKVFTRQDNLKNHERIHTGEKPYQCLHCGKVFARQDNFKIHERIHTGEKPYHCIQCEKSFKNQSALRQHIRTHTGERPYKCTRCEKCYTDRTSLRQHMKTHTANESFQCTSSITTIPFVTPPVSTLPVSTTSMMGTTISSLPWHNPLLSSSINLTIPMSVTPLQSHPIFTASKNPVPFPCTPPPNIQHSYPLCHQMALGSKDGNTAF